MTLIIKDWDKHFENNRTRDLKQMRWVPLPNAHDGDGYTELVDHENGAAHLGIWVAIVQVASKCEIRGTLMRDTGTPHDSGSLSRMTRLPKPLMQECITRLLKIGWIEETEPEKHKQQKGAVIPQVYAPNRLGMEGKGMEKKGIEDLPAQRPRDVVWDSVCELFGFNPQTKTEKTRVGKIVRDLKLKIPKGIHVKFEIETQIQKYKSTYPKVACTPEALLKHWDAIKSGKITQSEGQRLAQIYNPQ